MKDVLFKTFKDSSKKVKTKTSGKEGEISGKKAKSGVDMIKSNTDFGLAPKINKVNLLTFKSLKVGMLLLGK
jgi:hypothetical protein